MRFKARILYDDFLFHEFFTTIIHMYVDQDEIMMDFIEQLKKRHKIQRAGQRKQNAKLRAEGREADGLFEMNPEDIENIYDILEEGMEFEL